jgi:hypothetical protein
MNTHSFLLLDFIKARNVRDWSDKDLPLTEFVEKSRRISPFATLDGTFVWSQIHHLLRQLS